MLMCLSCERLELLCVKINIDPTLYNQEIRDKFHVMGTEHLRGVTLQSEEPGLETILFLI